MFFLCISSSSSINNNMDDSTTNMNPTGPLDVVICSQDGKRLFYYPATRKHAVTRIAKLCRSTNAANGETYPQLVGLQRYGDLRMFFDKEVLPAGVYKIWQEGSLVLKPAAMGTAEPPSIAEVASVRCPQKSGLPPPWSSNELKIFEQLIRRTNAALTVDWEEMRKRYFPSRTRHAVKRRYYYVANKMGPRLRTRK